MHGTVTLEAEVTNVSTHCFWLLLGDEELAVPFSDFPWFKTVSYTHLDVYKRQGKGKTRPYLRAREEPRIHVHVAHPEGEAKFWLTPSVHLARNVGLSGAQLRRAQAEVEAHIQDCLLYTSRCV